MIDTKSLVGSAVFAAVALASYGAAAGPAEAPAYSFEKCYGIGVAGKNDCQTAASSCAGTSVRDHQPDAWIFVPAGTCAKIAGGSTESKS